jgi:hypothetical protein
MPPDDSRLAVQRAQDEAARKWFDGGAKGRPPWARGERRQDPVFGVVVLVAVLVLIVAILIAFAA